MKMVTSFMALMHLAHRVGQAKLEGSKEGRRRA
jgi:hypothetical protein